jgi:aspartyl-tRNA(Asn)/glutamyl-tRNA(Gln) amidotransferase subunit A
MVTLPFRESLEKKMAESIVERIAAGDGDIGLTSLADALSAGEVTSEQLVGAYRDRYEEDQRHESPVNGYVEFFDSALLRARDADAARRGGDGRPLLGVPIAVKDNIHIRGERLTCASEILESYCAPYSATVIERLENAGFIFLGRTNMDEFAMGSSCEFSRYGAARNPVDRGRTCGGSSGGSAAVVASGQAPFALGSDTGGSVRLPAAFCGVYGYKPTYGVLSRYGLVAFGSSLDQIGFLTRSPSDLSAVLPIVTGGDPRDETSVSFACDREKAVSKDYLRGKRFGVPEELIGDGIDPAVRIQFDRIVELLESCGAVVEVFSLPILEACIAIYYIIAPAEASSNLSRYDGVKYGMRNERADLLDDMYKQTRMDGFGDEVKRRILIGNYVLSSGYYDAYYKKAQSVRRLLGESVEQAYASYDFILSPTAPGPAFRLGEKTDDPLSMYLTDICTTFANLTEVPAVSVPAGLTPGGLPVGVQIAGPRFSDLELLEVAEAIHGQESRV